MASLEKTLERARIALNNALNEPLVLNTLTQYGYDATRLQEGLALYEAARTLVQVQSDARHSKVSATKSFQQSLRQAKLHYHHDLRAARLALKEHEESRYFLQLKGTRAKQFDSWHEQARDFYFGLRDKPELQMLVATTGVTAERINQGIQWLQALDAARLQKSTEKGSAGDWCRQRNEALLALTRWMGVFRQVARAAFAAQPAYLTTLGLEPEPRKHKKTDAAQQEQTKPAKVKKSRAKKKETTKVESAPVTQAASVTVLM